MLSLQLMRLEDAPGLVAGKRTYLRRGSAAAITPRDMGDEERFTVDAVLRQERHEDERRKSISRTNDRRMSVGLPPLSVARRGSTSSALSGRSGRRDSARGGGRSARSGYSGAGGERQADGEAAPSGFTRGGVVADGVIPSPPPSEAPSQDPDYLEQSPGAEGDVEGDSAVLGAQQGMPFSPVISRVMHLQHDDDTIPGSPLDDSRMNIFAEPDMVDEGTSATLPPPDGDDAGGQEEEEEEGPTARPTDGTPRDAAADSPAGADQLQRASSGEVDADGAATGAAADGVVSDHDEAPPINGADDDVDDDVAIAHPSEAAAGAP